MKTFFDHLNAVTKEQKKDYWKTLDEPSRKTWNTYMTFRYLSMDRSLIETVDILQSYSYGLDDEHVYKLLIEFIPKSNRFLRYIKKDKADPNHTEVIDKLAQHFSCSIREAKDYYSLLDTSDVADIMALYDTTIETKKIKGKKRNENSKGKRRKNTK